MVGRVAQGTETGKVRPIRIFVNWNGELEMVFSEPTKLVSDLAKEIRSAPQVPYHHKFLVYKGLLLLPFLTLDQAVQNDGCLLHLVLNEDQYFGKPLHVKSLTGVLRSVMCGPDFYIEDVKEELSCFQGELPPESQRLVFAGRELQDQHTLREYNIQKPSVLLSVGPAGSGRSIEHFIDSISPRKDEMEVDPGTSIVAVKFLSEDRASSFWGKIHGTPDLATVSKSLIQVIERGCVDRQVEGRISIDVQDSLVIWTAKSDLQPGKQYTVMLNHDIYKPACPFIHKKSKEPVHGSISWNFFTVGYNPLRLTAIFPRPSSRVSVESAVIVIKFDREIHLGDQANQLVAVRGHDLMEPYYDRENLSLVFGFQSPPAPNEICRVRIRDYLIRSATGETLSPRQPDGIIKTTIFRWKFFAASSSLYAEANLASSGVARSIRSYRERVAASFSTPRAGETVQAINTENLTPGRPQREEGRRRNDALDWLIPSNILFLGLVGSIDEMTTATGITHHDRPAQQQLQLAPAHNQLQHDTRTFELMRRGWRAQPAARREEVEGRVEWSF